ncbi:MAG: hypothetical protein L3K09_08975 [Thermoplasmata archaeon]|nr:hypothetical protein [Thermoplasmata archaeon]
MGRILGDTWARPIRRRPRRIAVASVVGSAFAAMLFAGLAPSGFGAAPSRLITAPFHGAAKHADTLATTSCGFAAIPLGATFSLNTGAGGFRDRAFGKACPSMTGSIDVEELTTSTLEAVIPIHLHSSGSHSILVRWTVIAQGGVRATFANCQPGSSTTYTCSRGADAGVDSYSVLYDATTGVTLQPNKAWVEEVAAGNDTNCQAGTCSYYNGTFGGHYSGSTYYANFSGTFLWNAYVNGTLNRNDSYRLVTYVSGFAEVWFVTSSAGFTGTPSGAAWLNLAGGWHGAVLNSFSVS